MGRLREKGKKGEERASLYLKKRGYDIIERNFRSSFGEIDIIALERATETLVFVEVKYRSSLAFGHPLESITLRKAERIKKVASLYVQKSSLNYKSLRFDVIAILGNKLYHLVNAF